MQTPDFASLTGLRAVVTGSSSGIGRAMAVEFARAGADVIVHCRRALDAAREVAEACHRHGGKSLALQADFTERGELEDFVDRTWNAWGGLDIWVNNAGADLLTGPEAALDYEQKLQRLFEADIRATMLLSRHVGRNMKQAGSGSILNIGWDQADRGMEGDSGELFSASKNAIMGYTRSLALSLAPHVRVNCIAPGWIRTAWGEQAGDVWQQRVRRETPLGRWGTPEDIAALARFLVSPAASYITGQVICANGGAVR